jgi:hypothetical protein
MTNGEGSDTSSPLRALPHVVLGKALVVLGKALVVLGKALRSERQ